MGGPFGHPALARRQRVRGATPAATLRRPASLRSRLDLHVEAFGRFDEIYISSKRHSVLSWRGRCQRRVRVRRRKPLSRPELLLLFKATVSGLNGGCSTVPAHSANCPRSSHRLVHVPLESLSIISRNNQRYVRIRIMRTPSEFRSQSPGPFVIGALNEDIAK
jgi:hypothetical protein